jgi:hypothetical protein
LGTQTIAGNLADGMGYGIQPTMLGKVSAQQCLNVSIRFLSWYHSSSFHVWNREHMEVACFVLLRFGLSEPGPRILAPKRFRIPPNSALCQVHRQAARALSAELSNTPASPSMA